MNKKKVNIILVPLTIILWIMIMIKIVSYTKPEHSEDIISLPGNSLSEAVDTSDTFGLLLDYPDPFNHNIRGSSYLDNNNAKSQNISSDFFAHSPEPQLPDISFKGVIETDNDEKTVGLMVVNGRSVLVSKNDTVAGLRVMDCWHDSLRLKLNGMTFTVKR